uniref:Uncharacterized protein n=1 Tax=Cyclophora tenuis TaxID=216820 RepID=A0A7S1CX35_CYCTE
MSPTYDWDNSSQLTMESDSNSNNFHHHVLGAFPTVPNSPIATRDETRDETREEPGSPVSPPKLNSNASQTSFEAGTRQAENSSVKENISAGRAIFADESLLQETNDNDYHVPGRRRQYSFDQDKSKGALEERSLANGLGIHRAKTEAAMSVARLKAAKKQIARKKEELAAAAAAAAAAEEESPGISRMTTEEFLHYSEHALLTIRSNREKEDTTSQRLDFDGKGTSSPPDQTKEKEMDGGNNNSEYVDGNALQVADEVASEVDKILQRFRE